MEISEESKKFFEENIKEVQITLYPEGSIKTYKSLRGLCEFVQKECEFWRQLNKGRSSEIYNHFQQIMNTLNNVIKSTDTGIFRKYLPNVISTLKGNQSPGIFSSTFAAKIIKDVYSINPDYVGGAIDFLQNQTSNITRFQYFKGIMYAFFIMDRETAATKEISGEKEALEDLRAEYVNKLNTLHSEYLERTNNINQEHQDFTNQVEEWRKEKTDVLASFYEQKKQQFDELEKLYNEKLRISGPATYWKELSERYNKSGGTWRNFSIVLSAIMMTFLTLVLFLLPDKYFLTNNGQFNVASLKVMLFFAIVGSIGIYLIRLFVKLSTSSYHLSIDAYERYQLTHVFISLLKDNTITEQERIVVLQSIFSRADTGLLKGDSGPTLPEGPVQQIMKNVGK